MSWNQAQCPQGEPLEWWEYDPVSGLHWFGARPEPSLCMQCWEASQCTRQFSYSPDQHETLFGLLPLASRAAQRLLQQVRPWIEPAQSFEKNQLGLSQMFLNSLRLTWCLSLLADSAVLVRVMAWLDTPAEEHLLAPLAGHQLELGLRLEKAEDPN